MNSEQKRLMSMDSVQSLSAMESKYEKLIITADLAPAILIPGVYVTKEQEEKLRATRERTIEDLADETYQCYKAGASIVHIHTGGGKPDWSPEEWTRLFGLIREKCDIIIQMGRSTQTVEVRRPTMVSKPEMMSVMVTHHQEAFKERSNDLLHPTEEVIDQFKLCDEFNVKPELEIWHAGAIWVLNEMINRKKLKSPPFLTLMLGWPGGTWTPPTFEELMYRVKTLPPGCVWSTSSMAHPVPNSLNLYVLSIMLGGHLRTGTEDDFFIRPGVLAEDVHELVARIARISRELNREVATPSEARKIIGI